MARQPMIGIGQLPVLRKQRMMFSRPKKGEQEALKENHSREHAKN
jgi:hypothetical protein